MSDYTSGLYKSALINRLNRMLREAYFHGGDSGGPYGSNKDGLLRAMKEFSAWAGLDNCVIVKGPDGELQFAILAEEKRDNP